MNIKKATFNKKNSISFVAVTKPPCERNEMGQISQIIAAYKPSHHQWRISPLSSCFNPKFAENTFCGKHIFQAISHICNGNHLSFAFTGHMTCLSVGTGYPGHDVAGNTRKSVALHNSSKASKAEWLILRFWIKGYMKSWTTTSQRLFVWGPSHVKEACPFCTAPITRLCCLRFAITLTSAFATTEIIPPKFRTSTHHTFFRVTFQSVRNCVLLIFHLKKLLQFCTNL